MSAIAGKMPALVAITTSARGGTESAAPCAPMAWARGALLPLTALPWWQRLAYRLLRLPPLVRVEPEGETRILSIDNLHYSRPAASARCHNPDDYVLGIEFETDQGEVPRKASTFSRPHHPAYRRQEARDRDRYTGDLRECVEMTLAAENVLLRRQLAAVAGLAPRAGRLAARIERL